jgi:hypothetical protein
VDEYGTRLPAIQVERSVDRGIAGADHNAILVEVGIAFLVVVVNVRQVFTGDVHQHGRVEVTGGDHHMPRTVLLVAAILATCVQHKLVGVLDLFDRFVLTHVEIEIAHDALVVAECFAPVRFVAL